jgi:hypothetical protein
VGHRSIEIDLDMSMWPIDASDAGTRVLETHAEKYFRTLTSSLPVHYVFRTRGECDLEWHIF